MKIKSESMEEERDGAAKWNPAGEAGCRRDDVVDLQGCCRARENQWRAEEERGVGAGVAEPDKHTRDHVDMPMWRVAQAEGSRK